MKNSRIIFGREFEYYQYFLAVFFEHLKEGTKTIPPVSDISFISFKTPEQYMFYV